MARPQLTIVAGEVIEVQLSSDKLDLHGASRAAGLHGARIISSMRVFVRDDRGAEDNFDFDGADMGVRQGHRIVIALGADAKIPEPIPLALINVSTGEREEFLRNFALFTERPPRGLGRASRPRAQRYSSSRWLMAPAAFSFPKPRLAKCSSGPSFCRFWPTRPFGP